MDNAYEVTVLPGTRKKWFYVDERSKHGPNGPAFYYWYIHSGTVSWDRIIDEVIREQRFEAENSGQRPRRHMIFDAQNRTQVAEYLRGLGEPTYFMSTIHPHPLVKEREMPNTHSLSGRALFLERRMAKMQEELEKIEALPEEPEGMDEDDTNVVIWNARFPHGSRVYYYAARRADNGYWYTTGPKSEQGYLWADLIMWIVNEARPVDGMLWLVTEVEGEPLP